MLARNEMIEQDLLAKQTQKMLNKAANMDTYEKINHWKVDQLVYQSTLFKLRLEWKEVKL